ncbi:MAG: hypothetical protein QW416_08935 [Candidatus Nitrosocaldaceae archaeon]
MITGKGGIWRDRDKDRSDKLEAIARLILLVLIGMFTGYTLVSLFGLIIGGVLAFGVVWYFNKVVNGNGFSGFSLRGLRSDSSSISNLDIVSLTTRSIRLRYRCLSCNHTYTKKRECPKCGSKLKQVEF